MPPSLPAFPTTFSIHVTCQKDSSLATVEVTATCEPEHRYIEPCLAAFARLGERLDLPEGTLKITCQVGKKSVAFSQHCPSRRVSAFLAELAIIGMDDLAEMRRQVEGYPYEAIADEYVRVTLEHRRVRHKLPKIELDTSLWLPLTVADVIGGPATVIRTTSPRDSIRLRGIPFREPFAKLANEHIERNMRRELLERLPILRSPPSPSP